MRWPIASPSAKPDDWHLHVRDGAMLKAVLPFTAAHFGRAICMPNLVPPVMTVKDADRLSRARAGGAAGRFEIPAADDVLSDRQHRSGRCRGRLSRRRVHGGENVSRQCDDQFRLWRNRFQKINRVLARMEKIGMTLPDPWRGSRSRDRHFRPRGRVHRAPADADDPKFSRA